MKENGGSIMRPPFFCCLGSNAVFSELFADKTAERNFRTGAIMGDDFGSGNAADNGAGAQRTPLSETVQKSGGI